MKTKAQALVIVILVVMFFLGLVWTIVFMLENESRWTVKEKQETIAFQLADAAVDRGYWKLRETTANFENILKGITIPLYDGTTTFSDIPGGYYKIKISSTQLSVGGVSEGAVVIQGIGTDLGKKETRGIKAIYTREAVEASIFSLKGVQIKGGSAELHWGPVISKEGDIVLTGAAVSDYFPRKFAGTGFRVIPRDPNAPGVAPDEGPPTRRSGGAWVDDWEKEWRSNVELGDIDIALERYIELAKAYRPPKGRKVRIGSTEDRNFTKADPPGSGYIPASAGDVTFYGGMGDNDAFRDYCSSATYFIGGNCRIQDNAFIGPNPGTTEPNNVTLIVMGNLELSGMGGFVGYEVKVPTEAYKEYQYFDTAASNEYYGDAGYRRNSATFRFPTTGSDIQYPNLCGLVYVGRNLEVSGIQQIIGVTIVRGDIIGSGQAKIYYTHSVKRNIEHMAYKLKRRYWAEFDPKSFDTPKWSD